MTDEQSDIPKGDGTVTIIKEEINTVNVVENKSSACCCCCCCNGSLSNCLFSGEDRAFGFCATLMARGPLAMSNIFLATAILWLANEEAGCIIDDEINEDCDSKVYGQKPSSLITNIAVIAGLLSAFVMPFVGAVIDFTPYRRSTAIVTSIIITLIQLAQIGTNSSTWFIMAVLQSVSGFLYQVQILTSSAYLPEMSRSVGQKAMTKFCSTFVISQFSTQSTFLILVVLIGLVFDMKAPAIARVSQAISSVWIAIFFYISWGQMLPSVPARNQLESGKCLLTEGFIQNWRTAIDINRKYKKGLRWFLLGETFAEAGAWAFSFVSVSFMDEALHMSATSIGFMFFIATVSCLPGSKISQFVTQRTNPNTSIRLCLTLFSIFTFVAALVLDSPDRKPFAYLFGSLWGMCLGWFFSVVKVFFSMCLPKGQEAELSGFYVYCTQVLAWLPPLVFTSLNEAGVSLGWSLTSVAAFFMISVLIFSCAGSWDDILREAAIGKYEIDDGDVKEKEKLGNEDLPASDNL